MKGSKIMEELKFVLSESLVNDKTVYEVFKKMEIEKFVNQALSKLLANDGKKAKKEMLDSVSTHFIVEGNGGYYEFAPLFLESFLSILCHNTLILWKNSKYTELCFPDEDTREFFDKVKKEWMDNFVLYSVAIKRVEDTKLFTILWHVLANYYNEDTEDIEDTEGSKEDNLYNTHIAFRALGTKFYKEWLEENAVCAVTAYKNEIRNIIRAFREI